MFWRMTGSPVASPVDTILDKENCTLEELLDEDEIIQECRAMNNRLINFLHERTQIEQLLRYVIEAAPEEADKKRTFRLPFISCEILTCDVDVLLQSLVEDEELMNLLFSFLKPDHPRSSILAAYFSKVVLCMIARKTAQLVGYVQLHPEILHQLVDLIGTTSIMEVLIHLIGADENMHSSFTDALQLLDPTDVLDLIVDKFCSSDSPEVHANAAEVLCAVTRYAPPRLARKVCCPSFVGRLLDHALEDSRPKSVLIQLLSVCICLLDPKRLLQSSYQSFRSQLSHGSVVVAGPEVVDLMLERLGYLLKLLDVATPDITLPTTFGCLKPPLGKHRLKIVEFISILFTLGSEDAEKELIRLEALRHSLDLFFEYPFNNFLHHQVESIIASCLESKKASLVEHVLLDCDIVGKILLAEKQLVLPADCDKPIVLAQGRSPPRIGNIGHLTRIANKLVQGAKNYGIIQKHLQENSEWVDWHAKVLVKRNSVENIFSWACGRPNSLHDRIRDGDNENVRGRDDYDVAALAGNMRQAFQYKIFGSDDDIEEDEGSPEHDKEVQGSLEHDKEDICVADESAEVVISSVRLGGGDKDRYPAPKTPFLRIPHFLPISNSGSHWEKKMKASLPTNSDGLALEGDRAVNDPSSSGSLASPSRNLEDTDEVVVSEIEELTEKPTSSQLPSSSGDFQDAGTAPFSSGSLTEEIHGNLDPSGEGVKPPEWIEWRESTESKNAQRTEIGLKDHGKDAVVSADQGGGTETENQEPESSPDSDDDRNPLTSRS